MKYSNMFFEIYAMLSLCKYFNLSEKKMRKTERPDWIYRRGKIGIEVTRAIPSRWAQFDNMVEEYIYENVNKSTFLNDEVPGYIDDSYKRAAYVPGEDDLDLKIVLDELIKRITIKEHKKEKYIECKENWLYVFAATCMINEYEIASLIKKIDHVYDKIFINTQDKIFLVNRDRVVDIISLSEEDMKCLRVETFKRHKKYYDFY